MANDISNLLGRFGANANGYMEVAHEIEYKELPKARMETSVASANSRACVNEPDGALLFAGQKNAAALLSVVVENVLPPVEERVEPVMDGLPEVFAAEDGVGLAAASVHAIPSSLRSMLSEVALAREANGHAGDKEASLRNMCDLTQPVTPAQVIAIVSPKGGVGKTTISAALAAILSRKSRVIAIDLDSQNVLQYHLGVDSAAANPAAAGLAAESWSTSLRDGTAGTRVLPYGEMSEAARRAHEHRMATDTHWLAGQLARMNLHVDDVVILDTPAGRTPYLEQSLAVADQVAVVLTPDAGSFMALEHIAHLFDEHAGCSFIVNQFDVSRAFCQDMLEVFKRRYGTRLVGVISLDHAISEALAYGVNTLLENAQLPLQQEIRAISDALKPDTGTFVRAGTCA